MIKKKILITGANGFVGKNLSKLLKNKFQIYGIGNINKNKKNNNYKLLINKPVTFKNLYKYFSKENQFDYIVHCAGKVIGLDPINDFKKNVLTTQELLEFVRIKNIKSKIIYISTIAVNPNNSNKLIKENFNSSPISNYGLNKKISEDLFKFYYKKFKINSIIIRLTSLYGPGLKTQFIYDSCKKISKDINEFKGSGQEERDWLHISDFTNFIHQVIKSGFNGIKIINCGSGKSYKIKYILELLKKIFKKNIILNFDLKISKDNPKKLDPELKNIKKYNWKPKKKIDLGLKEYVEWFKKEFKIK
jgi:UDP-glucose 4-epimerase